MKHTIIALFAIILVMLLATSATTAEAKNGKFESMKLALESKKEHLHTKAVILKKIATIQMSHFATKVKKNLELSQKKENSHKMQAQQTVDCNNVFLKFVTAAGSASESDPFAMFSMFCPAWASFNAEEKKCLTELTKDDPTAPDMSGMFDAICVTDSKGNLCILTFSVMTKCEAPRTPNTCAAVEGCKWKNIDRNENGVCELVPDYKLLGSLMCGECFMKLLTELSNAMGLPASEIKAQSSEANALISGMCVKDSTGGLCIERVGKYIPDGDHETLTSTAEQVKTICETPDDKSCFMRILQGTAASQPNITSGVNKKEYEQIIHSANNMCAKNADGKYCNAFFSGSTVDFQACASALDDKKSCSSACAAIFENEAKNWGCCYASLRDAAHRADLVTACGLSASSPLASSTTTTVCAVAAMPEKKEMKIALKTKWSDLEAKPQVKAKLQEAMKKDVAATAGVGTSQIVNEELVAAGSGRSSRRQASSTARKMLAEGGTDFVFDIQAESAEELTMASSSVDTAIKSESGMVLSSSSDVLVTEGMAKKGENFVDAEGSSSSSSAAGVSFVAACVAMLLLSVM